MDNSAETITTVTAADLIGDYDVVQYMPATHYLLVDPEQLKALEDRIVERILDAIQEKPQRAVRSPTSEDSDFTIV
jgi:hypothetical protein